MTGKNINELASNLDTLNSIISCCDTQTDKGQIIGIRLPPQIE